MKQQSKANARLNPHISVDCVLFGYEAEQLTVLLLERSYFTDEGRGEKIVLDWALPGNLIRDDESLNESANRILKELTNFEDVFLRKFSEFDDPDRIKSEKDRQWLKAEREKPEARVLTIAYFGLVKSEQISGKTDSITWQAEWFPVNALPELAFDHQQIIAEAVRSLQGQLRQLPIAFDLLPEEFTLSEAQRLYEAILGHPLDKRNFVRKMKKLNLLISLNKKQKGVAHKPAEVYRFNYEASGNLGDFF